jgi:hypothetical protein
MEPTEPVETELQPDPPEGSLVQDEGVNAGEVAEGEDASGSRAAARSGGDAGAGERQLQGSVPVTDLDDGSDEELVGAPEQDAESRDAGGQDSGSID